MKAIVTTSLLAALFVFASGCGQQQQQGENKPQEKSKAEKIKEARAQLSAEDQKLVEAQEFCAVHQDNRLGSMGKPVKVMLNDKPVFLCCGGCEEAAKKDAAKTLESVEELKTVQTNRAKLSAEDRKLVEEQQYCAVQSKDRLGGDMGAPVKVMVKGQPVFLCCEGCKEDAEKNPEKTLEKVAELKKKNTEK
jgi:hypothetical protein